MLHRTHFKLLFTTSGHGLKVREKNIRNWSRTPKIPLLCRWTIVLIGLGPFSYLFFIIFGIRAQYVPKKRLFSPKKMCHMKNPRAWKNYLRATNAVSIPKCLNNLLWVLWGWEEGITFEKMLKTKKFSRWSIHKMFVPPKFEKSQKF